MGRVNVFEADDPLLIFTMQMTFMAENIAIFLNIALISFFHYQIRKENERALANQPGGGSASPRSHKSSFTHSRSVSKSSSASSSNKSRSVSKQTVQLTYAFLFVGFMFSIFQGLIENWLAPDCGAEWLQWCTFLFYFTHRCLLLFAFLQRLMTVFRGSCYAYPSIFYYFLFFAIISYGIVGFIIYGIDYFIVKVDIEMWHGSGGNILCSWGFGEAALGVRGIELALTFVLLSAFLYKLGKLHLDTSAMMGSDGDNTKQQSKLNTRLLVVFRKLTFLTLAALSTSVVVTMGYINFKPLAFALSLDAVFNSFCVVLMFQFNHKIIRPCFGRKCDRCFCVKFVGNHCKCVIVGQCCYSDSNVVIEEHIAGVIGVKQTKMNALPTVSVEMESHNDGAQSAQSCGENQTESEESQVKVP